MKNDANKLRVLIIPVIINTVILTVLSTVHFYWAFGGKRLYEDVLPTSSNGLHKLNPSMTAGVVIAVGLLFLALMTAGNLGLFNKYIRKVYFRYGTLLIAIIFLVRAIGDFKFIGFFKRVKGTRFGINDTQFFSPLCLVIAILSLLIFIFNRRTMTGTTKG